MGTRFGFARWTLLLCTVITVARGSRQSTADGTAPAEATPTPIPFTVIHEAEGKKVPLFSVSSGHGKKLTQRDLGGRVSAIFYETRDVVEKNRAAKSAIARFAEGLSTNKGDWASVAIIDASGANVISRGVWRAILREKSSEEGITIYGDWDGSAGSAFGVRRGDSNLILTDRAGRIRYLAYGRFDRSEIEKIIGRSTELLQAPEHLPAEDPTQGDGTPTEVRDEPSE
jgi:hypothetical protein